MLFMDVICCAECVVKLGKTFYKTNGHNVLCKNKILNVKLDYDFVCGVICEIQQISKSKYKIQTICYIDKVANAFNHFHFASTGSVRSLNYSNCFYSILATSMKDFQAVFNS